MLSETSVLTAGYDGVEEGKSLSPNTEKAKEQTTFSERSWEREIQSRGRRYPDKRFLNPSKDELMSDLRALAQKHDFELVSVRLLTPRQLAPKIVARTEHDLDLAHAKPRPTNAVTAPGVLVAFPPKRDSNALRRLSAHLRRETLVPTRRFVREALDEVLELRRIS